MRLGFAAVLAFMLVICLTYLLREKERAIIREIKKTKGYKKLAKPAKKLWMNTLKPKLEFVENKAVLVPEFAILLEHFKSSRHSRKTA